MYSFKYESIFTTGNILLELQVIVILKSLAVKNAAYKESVSIF